MSIEYKKNEDGSFALWSCGQPKVSKDLLTVQKAKLSADLEAFDELAGLSKVSAQIVAQIVQQQSDLMNKPDFTWAEIIAKFKAPLEEQKAAIETALAVAVEPK